MSVAKAQMDAKRDKKRGRGSVDNKSRLDAFRSAGPASGADWGGCDPRKLQAVIVAITALGGACTIGLSRNKGAHSLTLLLDEGRETLWFNRDADLDDELDEVRATIEAMG